ncbi:MAG TPA: DUF3883 domain-containing protein [Allosphingosinicella sp.]|jgi:hypothetical protein|nr:DUF3883 domain-containing protein [Allosphingosinicella sp.]
MNAVRRADGLLSAGQTIVLLEMLDQSHGGVTPEQVARDLSARRAASYSRTYNSIAMLEEGGIVALCEGRVQLRDPAPEDWRPRIADWVMRRIADRIAQHGAHALQLHDGDLVIDPMQLPGPVDGLRLWLIEFGIAWRSGSSSRQWLIAKEFEGFFLNAARSWNNKTRRQISQAALEEQLAQQAVDGAVAEEWILQRERKRLAGHPLIEQVIRLSIEDAGAGFDIISFSNTTSIVHDRFLEIKSFSGSRRFFWSRNEIGTARRLGEMYHLCIVDRDRMQNPDYAPQIISGPYAALIETEDNGWSISPTTYECVALRS